MEVLTVEEMGRLLRVGRNRAYELAHQPGFPVLRVGKRLLVPRAALQRWMEQQLERETK